VSRLAEIPGVRFAGRPIRPFHLALALSCGFLSALEYVNSTPLSTTGFGDVLGVVAVLAAVLLTVGWWGRSDRAAEWGLLLAAGVWAQRAAAVLLTDTVTFGTVELTAGLSASWAVGAAGAYWLERADHHATRNGAGEVSGE